MKTAGNLSNNNELSVEETNVTPGLDSEPNNSLASDVNTESEKWKLYRNDDFGFKFKYPDLGIIFETETELDEFDNSTNISFNGHSKFDNHLGTLFDLFIIPKSR